MPEEMTKPICKTVNCKRELTWLEDSKCFRCLVCNPLASPAATVKPERKYIDVAMTEARVREICRDELENWHIQRPPVTRDNIAEKIIAEDEWASPHKPLTETEEEIVATGGKALATKMAEKNWRQQARELDIPLFQRKKTDVLQEIESRLTEKTETSPDGDKTPRP